MMTVYKVYKETYNAQSCVWVVDKDSEKYVNCTATDICNAIKNLNKNFHYDEISHIKKNIKSVEEHFEFLSKKVAIVEKLTTDEITTMGINYFGILSEFKSTLIRLQDFERDYISHLKLEGYLKNERYTFKEIYLHETVELSGGIVIVPKQEKD